MCLFFHTFVYSLTQHLIFPIIYLFLFSPVHTFSCSMSVCSSSFTTLSAYWRFNLYPFMFLLLVSLQVALRRKLFWAQITSFPSFMDHSIVVHHFLSCYKYFTTLCTQSPSHSPGQVCFCPPSHEPVHPFPVQVALSHLHFFLLILMFLLPLHDCLPICQEIHQLDNNVECEIWEL